MHSPAQSQANQLVVSDVHISNSCDINEVFRVDFSQISKCLNDANVAEKVKLPLNIAVRNSMIGYITAF